MEDRRIFIIFKRKKYTNLTHTPEECFMVSEEGVLTNYVCYYKDVVIPKMMAVRIVESAFRSNQLTSVEIPDSVETIGRSAFEYNQLTSITIPNSIRSISNNVFRNNPNLKLTIEKPENSITGSS